MKRLLFFFLFFFLFEKAYSYTGLNVVPTLKVFQDPLEIYFKNIEEGILLSEEQARSKIIESVSFEGNNRTSNDVITNNILLKVGEPFQEDLFHTTLTNLKNLQVFSKINIEIRKNKSDKLVVNILLTEKWTMIPYLIAGSGGGSGYFAVGMYDTNFIGRLYTFNFTYGCKNYNCSTVAFFRNPSLFGQKINYVVSGGQYHNVFNIYDSNRNLIGTFSNEQSLLTTYADFQIQPKLSLGGGIIYQNNKINNSGLSKEELQSNTDNKYSLPNSTNSTALETRLTLGQINYDGIVVDGVNYVSIIDSTLQTSPQEDNNYTSTSNTVLFYNVLPFIRNSYFAFRGNVSVTSSNIMSQYFYLGGLDKIRGFYDGEFSGKFSWFSNSELRVPSYIGEYIALQHVLFSDSGYAANSFGEIFTSNTAVSVGTGIRILFLEINKIAFRADFAYTINPFYTYGLSLGLLQFF